MKGEQTRRRYLPPYATEEVCLMASVTSGKFPFLSFLLMASLINEGVAGSEASGSFRK